MAQAADADKLNRRSRTFWEAHQMARSGPEINAEAKNLAAEVDTLVSKAQGQLQAAQRAIEDAETIARYVQDAASQAIKSVTQSNITDGERHCANARGALVRARSTVADAFVGVAGGDPKDEWKECRTSIDRFDKLLVDLRKTGFGFVTTVVGAAALFIGTAATNPAPEPKFAVFFIVAVLILTLFAVDCTHQAWLKAAVERSITLEKDLNYQITKNIRNRFTGVESLILGICLYLLFLGTTGIIFWESLNGHASYQRSMEYVGAAVSLIIVFAAFFTYFR